MLLDACGRQVTQRNRKLCALPLDAERLKPQLRDKLQQSLQLAFFVAQSSHHVQNLTGQGPHGRHGQSETCSQGGLPWPLQRDAKNDRLVGIRPLAKRPKLNAAWVGP